MAHSRRSFAYEFKRGRAGQRRPFGIWCAAQTTPVYLAGPITGVPELNRPLFAYVTTLLRNGGAVVINPLEFQDDALPYTAMLHRVLTHLVSTARTVLLLPGWTRSYGARIECDLALMLEYPVWELHDLDLAKAPHTWTVLPYEGRPDWRSANRPRPGRAPDEDGDPDSLLDTTGEVVEEEGEEGS